MTKHQENTNIGPMSLNCVIFQEHDDGPSQKESDGARRDVEIQAEDDPIMMGAQKMGFSEADKYLDDQISQEGPSASVTEMPHKREKGLTEK